MKKRRHIKLQHMLLFGTALILLHLSSSVHALEQGEPADALSLKEIPFFEYDLHKNEGPQRFTLKLPVAIETSGLVGPLSLDNPVAGYFWEEYKEAGIQRAVEYDPVTARYYKTPFIRLMGVQRLGTPVKIKLLAPEPEEISMPLAGAGGQSGNTNYRVVKRYVTFKIHNSEGYLSASGDDNKINLVKNQESMEISWTPSMVEDDDELELNAPIVVEINLGYKIKREIIIDGKTDDGLSRDNWVERRVAWLALPVCGQEFGEDDEPLACPAAMAPEPAWKEYTLETVNLQVPENWSSRTRGGNGRFELGDEIAGITVVREEGAEKQLEYLKERTEKNINISGLNAVAYSGLVKDGKVRAQLIVFNDTPSDGEPLAIATILKDEKYSGMLDAIIGSVKIDSGPADPPMASTLPSTLHIPELSDLGSGEYTYSTSGTPPKEYEKVQWTPDTVKEEDTAQADTPEQNSPTTEKAEAPGRLKLIKIKSFRDFAGRNEALVGNGSPDCRLSLEIEAPDRVITGAVLREVATQKAIWDTTKGNNTWLLVITKNNKPINQNDGSVNYQLGKGEEKLELWFQDNHTIAGGKKELELVLSFENSQPLIIPLIP